MRGNPKNIVVARIVALTLGAAGAAGAGFVDAAPAPRIIGNDTGGIISYSPDLKGTYRQIAQAYCARWGRLSHITSVHRRYGDYIGFACIDKPWMIH